MTTSSDGESLQVKHSDATRSNASQIKVANRFRIGGFTSMGLVGLLPLASFVGCMSTCRPREDYLRDHAFEAKAEHLVWMVGLLGLSLTLLGALCFVASWILSYRPDWLWGIAMLVLGGPATGLSMVFAKLMWTRSVPLAQLDDEPASREPQLPLGAPAYIRARADTPP
jgi:hypothetical protein